MYLTNKYTKWYNSIIKTAQGRVLPAGTYVERHHIIPKSLGGTEVVALTAREHYVCHLLLTKMLPKPAVFKMITAVWRMANATKEQAKLYRISGHRYELLRKARKNVKMSAEAKAKSSATKKAKHLSSWNKGIPRTEENKAKVSAACLAKAQTRPVWNKGRAHPPETIAKIAERARNRLVLTCPHCSKTATGSNYLRWHGDNCKAIILPSESRCPHSGVRSA